MPYFIKVISTSDKPIHILGLEQALNIKDLKAEIHLEKGTKEDWNQLLISHLDGKEISVINRYNYIKLEDKNHLFEDVKKHKPRSAVRWLKNFFKIVRSEYYFQVLHSGVNHKSGWDILETIYEKIWSLAPSIKYADLEGYSNLEGDHILWQFSDDANGWREMAVLKSGKWIKFEMDLANKNHQSAFQNGKVPGDIKI